jgi:hypothetical protein
LGLDPYVVSDRTAADVIDIAANLPGELHGDFFDSADPAALADAAEWTRRAVAAAGRAAAKARLTLHPLYRAATASADESPASSERPWATGYALARRVRSELQLQSTDRFDISPWVGEAVVSAPSAGVQGTVAVDRDRCGVVLEGGRRSSFGRARALGRVLARPTQRSFVLSGARGYDERVAGAFAAELLAPAQGIHEMLATLGEQDDFALETVARSFRVSPLVVRHQYDNQLAGVAGETGW